LPFSLLGTPYPVSTMRSVFARPRGGRVQQNYSRIGSEAIDEALDGALAESDPERVRALVNTADRLIWRQASVLPLYQRPQLVATRANLANLGACGCLQPDYQDSGFTRLPEGPARAGGRPAERRSAGGAVNGQGRQWAGPVRGTPARCPCGRWCTGRSTRTA